MYKKEMVFYIIYSATTCCYIVTTFIFKFANEIGEGMPFCSWTILK